MNIWRRAPTGRIRSGGQGFPFSSWVGGASDEVADGFFEAPAGTTSAAGELTAASVLEADALSEESAAGVLSELAVLEANALLLQTAVGQLTADAVLLGRFAAIPFETVEEESEEEEEDMARTGQQPLWEDINATAAGDNTILAAVASTKHRVISVHFTCSAAVTVSWKSGANVLIQPMSYDVYGKQEFVGNYFNYWCETNSNEALIVSLGGAVDVRGRICYQEVPA